MMPSQTWRYVGVTVGLVIPLLAVSLSPWREVAAVVLFAVLGALNAAAISAKALVHTFAGTAGIAFIAAVAPAASPTLPLLGAALVAILGAATAALVPRGLGQLGVVRIALAAHLLINPGPLTAEFGVGPGWDIAAAVALTVIIASLWVLTLTLVFFPGARAIPEHPETSTAYPMLLAALCGMFTFACLVWFPHTNAWWTVLTVALVLQPTASSTARSAAERVVGTIAGAVIAASIAAITQSTIALTVLATIAAVACVVLTVTHAPYWTYSSAVTIAVILSTFTPTTVVRGDEVRVLATLVAASAATIAVIAADRIIDHIGERREPRLS